MLKLLQQTLSTLDKPTFMFEPGDGSHLLVLANGARVLGLFPGSSEDNFFWTNPLLEVPHSAARLFAPGKWSNSGGDRTWLAPELDIFYPGYPDTSRHVVPLQLDSAGYEVLRKHHQIGLIRRLSLYLARAFRDIELEMMKWLEAAPNPLRGEPALESAVAAVEYAGYTQQIHLKLSADLATKGLAVGIWNILQLPHGGEVIIPTNLQASPRVLFGEAPADRLTCEERCVRLRADFAGEYKIAVRAAYATGRIGYLRQSGSTWSLVVRNFMVNPSGDYVDVPKDDPQDTGYCVQATNVLHTTGAYCELGYHAPAIGRTEGKTTTSDVSQVWAFRGPLEPIQTIARALLGVDPRLS